MEPEIKPCPFCGAEISIIPGNDVYQIVGCSNRTNPASSMLCPNPSMIIYKRDGEWDYQFWNRRVCDGTRV